MKCNKAQSLMLDHLYGDLKPRRQKAFLQHLQECRTCSEEFEAHKATSSAFAKLDMEEPSPELSTRIAAMAARDLERQELLRPLTSAWNWKPAMATVAAATVAVVIIVRYVPHQTIRPPQQLSFDAPVSRSVQATKKPSLLPSRAKRQEAASRPEAMMMKEKESFGYGMPAGAVVENGMSATEYEEHAMTGDDMAADSIALSIPESRARGFGGGEYAEEQLRDSKVIMQAPAPAAKLEPERPALKSKRSIGRLDASIVASVDEGFLPAESAKTPVVTSEQQEPPAAESTEILLEKDDIKKEMSITIGGKTYHDGRKSDLDTAVDEFARSNVDFDRREFNEAVMNYRDVVGMEADKQFSAKAMHRLGGTYGEMDQCESAISVYEAVIEEHPDYPDLADVYLAVGECYLAMGKAEDAVRNFEIVRERFPAKRELALQKISATASMQEASEKANEAQAEEQE